MSGGGDVPIPTPITGNDLIYFNSAHGPSSPILAVKTSATGDITLKPGATTNEYIMWSIPRGGSYIHSLLLYRGRLYNVNWNGTIQCYDPIQAVKYIMQNSAGLKALLHPLWLLTESFILLMKRELFTFFGTEHHSNRSVRYTSTMYVSPHLQLQTE